MLIIVHMKMKSLIPNKLLNLLVFWLPRCCSRVNGLTLGSSSLTSILELGSALSYLLFVLHHNWVI